MRPVTALPVSTCRAYQLESSRACVEDPQRDHCQTTDGTAWGNPSAEGRDTSNQTATHTVKTRSTTSAHADDSCQLNLLDTVRLAITSLIQGRGAG